MDSWSRLGYETNFSRGRKKRYKSIFFFSKTQFKGRWIFIIIFSFKNSTMSIKRHVYVKSVCMWRFRHRLTLSVWFGTKGSLGQTPKQNLLPICHQFPIDLDHIDFKDFFFFSETFCIFNQVWWVLFIFSKEPNNNHRHTCLWRFLVPAI